MMDKTNSAESFKQGLAFSCACHLLFIFCAAVIFAGVKSPAPRGERLYPAEIYTPAASPGTEAAPAQAVRRQPPAPAAIARPPLNGVAETAKQSDLPAPAGVGNENAGGETSSGAGGGAGTAAGTGKKDGAGTAGGSKLAETIERFVRRVERNKGAYPYMALKQNKTGVAHIYVKLNADGSLAEQYVAASSGEKSLDEGALKAVRKACPFPHGLPGGLAMTVPVRWTLS
ncbi:MAG: energy transducer TonB [Acidaminococcales bacterium]|jgi:protein TonB|nr:energy transducer TonB [Acidaminococcales bacterium]